MPLLQSDRFLGKKISSEIWERGSKQRCYGLHMAKELIIFCEILRNKYKCTYVIEIILCEFSRAD